MPGTGPVTAASRALLFRALERVTGGRLEVHLPAGAIRSFGDPSSDLHAIVRVHDERVFARGIRGGDIAFGEAYAEGLWSSPDLVSVVRLAVRNQETFDAGARLPATLSRWIERARHFRHRNSVSGSRANIRYHYDLGTEFYSLFLDPSLTYSCGVFETPGATLEEAQRAKLDRIAEKLQLSPGDRLLEIGTGWGALAIHAATRYGCRVTTTTISAAQHAHMRERLEREGLAGKVELLFEDYRNLTGRFDKAVSIEMFEAVGLAYYDDFFSAVDRALEPGGAMLLQTITMNEARFARYRHQPDFIRRHIFPGSELASLGEIRKSLARATDLSVVEVEEIGSHYARTLAAWRERFLAARDRVRALGFPETFIRMWDYYLAYCQGGFAERHIGDAQVLLARNAVPVRETGRGRVASHVPGPRA
jgi:cyclopropane-fatty-acyl-phospholipid synthase